ncbi:glutathione S-transferase [Halobacteriovorax sp. GB3]|uniref:glutathione S-transferase n=1 Tax=Halobacteriovorax sp. GB3 TaxID=2719615 RepID=UPI00235F34F5|nr:glutathione S-transferase [Halobacteriovorax sp. GB3]MDD0854355.1 glutathione S-transferase [Halobacteriovorax sp. GB3]
MITVHHLNDSRSQRILWLLEELGLEYEIKFYQRDPQTSLAPKELKDVHALGKSPVITDGDLTIAESGAIIEYLVNKYQCDAIFRPEKETEKIQFSYWLHFAEGSLMPPLLLKLVFDKVKNAPMPFFVKPIARGIADKVMKGFIGPNITNNFDFIEAHLAKNEWFCGDKLTGADFQMSFPLEAGMTRVDNREKYPAILAFLDKIHSREGYKKALEKGGEYSYSGK